jgi:hypothetical protein
MLGVLCFMLPFFTFSCQNGDIVRFSGMQLAFGTTGHEVIMDQSKGNPQGGRNSAEDKQHIQSVGSATIALVAGLAAAIMAFSKRRRSQKISMGLAILAVICLVILQGQITADWLIHQFNPREPSGNPGITVRAEFGFFVALLAFAAGAVMNGLCLRTKPATSKEAADNAAPQ